MPNHSPISDLTGHIWPPPELCIVGGGIGGLVTGILCENAKIPYVILEKLDRSAHPNGADIGLHANAIDILSKLGIDDSFWYQHSYRADHIHYCNADFLLSPSQAGPPPLRNSLEDDSDSSSSLTDSTSSTLINSSAPSSSYSSQASSSSSSKQQLGAVPPAAANNSANSFHSKVLNHYNNFKFCTLDEFVTSEPIKSLSMSNILGNGHIMRICSRRSLMLELVKRVPPEKILYESSVLQCSENDNHVEIIFTHQHAFASLVVPLVIGADGIRSSCRNLTTHPANPLSSPVSLRYTGAICYRGCFPIAASDAAQHALHALLVRKEIYHPQSVCSYQNRAVRFSFGFLNEAHSMCYWWVSESWHGNFEELRALMKSHRDLANPPPNWPVLLQTLYCMTDPNSFYLHPNFVRDADLNPCTWFSDRCVLLGDAAHPSTPALFQGANMAIEDAHRLITLIQFYPPSVPPWIMFDQYAKTRIKHVAQLQKLALRHTKLSHLNSKTATALKDAVLKLIPTHLLESALRKNLRSDRNIVPRDDLAKKRAGPVMRRFSVPVLYTPQPLQQYAYVDPASCDQLTTTKLDASSAAELPVAPHSLVLENEASKNWDPFLYH